MTEQINNSRIGEEKISVNELVDKLTLFDDDLMSRVFDNNIEATELILRIILGRDIKVISVDGQDEIKNHEVGGRNIKLDVHAIDVDGEEKKVEILDIHLEEDSASLDHYSYFSLRTTSQMHCSIYATLKAIKN